MTTSDCEQVLLLVFQYFWCSPPFLAKVDYSSLFWLQIRSFNYNYYFLFSVDNELFKGGKPCLWLYLSSLISYLNVLLCLLVAFQLLQFPIIQNPHYKCNFRNNWKFDLIGIHNVLLRKTALLYLFVYSYKAFFFWGGV